MARKYEVRVFASGLCPEEAGRNSIPANCCTREPGCSPFEVHFVVVMRGHEGFGLLPEVMK